MGKEGEKEGEKHQCVVASCTPPTGDLVHNPDMYPDWESNWWPFGLQAGTQSTEPYQPQHMVTILTPVSFLCCDMIFKGGFFIVSFWTISPSSGQGYLSGVPELACTT